MLLLWSEDDYDDGDDDDDDVGSSTRTISAGVHVGRPVVQRPVRRAEDQLKAPDTTGCGGGDD